MDTSAAGAPSTSRRSTRRQIGPPQPSAEPVSSTGASSSSAAWIPAALPPVPPAEPQLIRSFNLHHKKVEWAETPALRPRENRTSSPMPLDIVNEEWQQVSEKGTVEARYQLAVERFGFCSAVKPTTDQQKLAEWHRCRYVWKLWRYFSATRLWRASQLDTEHAWVMVNVELFLYIYRTLKFYSEQLRDGDSSSRPEQLCDRSANTVIRRTVETIGKSYGSATWLYHCGMIGNPWHQPNFRKLCEKLEPLLAKHPYSQIMNGIQYALVNKLFYGQLESEGENRKPKKDNSNRKPAASRNTSSAKVIGRHRNDDRETLPLDQDELDALFQQQLINTSDRLERIRKERYLMPADLRDVKIFLEFDAEVKILWARQWIAPYLRQLQEREQLPPLNPIPQAHPYPPLDLGPRTRDIELQTAAVNDEADEQEDRGLDAISQHSAEEDEAVPPETASLTGGASVDEHDDTADNDDNDIEMASIGDDIHQDIQESVNTPTQTYVSAAVQMDEPSTNELDDLKAKMATEMEKKLDELSKRHEEEVKRLQAAAALRHQVQAELEM
ncbi:hypothetical protein QFC22_002419 [Naganishia vaughanmartiniae]|uniref:Uncharacterized protein n=1 Tax=Naganishia vaughanmartiniae TaxID=1424756 RepID=A0ACC2XFI4_9TREE|nr:hypothetical protein QFC22_002419 [Naganishia vaughanmartiniae]